MGTRSLAAPIRYNADRNCPRRGGRQLLIVQQSAAAGRALGRLMMSFYATVHVASCPHEASAVLRGARGMTVDLVCGQRFGSPGRVGSVDSGVDWIVRWRREASLGLVVLATAEPPKQLPRGVDAIFAKPLDPLHLLAFLRPALQPAA